MEDLGRRVMIASTQHTHITLERHIYDKVHMTCTCMYIYSIDCVHTYMYVRMYAYHALAVLSSGVI